MKRTGLPIMIAVLTALTLSAGNWLGFHNSRLPQGRPHMPSSHGGARFRRKAENGKWSMRCHRGRVK